MKYGRMYITECRDCGENDGGYFCQIYYDEDCEKEIDNFCIHKEELELIPTTEFWKMAFACGCYFTVLDALRKAKSEEKPNKITKISMQCGDDGDPEIYYTTDTKENIEKAKREAYNMIAYWLGIEDKEPLGYDKYDWCSCDQDFCYNALCENLKDLWSEECDDVVEFIY